MVQTYNVIIVVVILSSKDISQTDISKFLDYQHLPPRPISSSGIRTE